MDDFDGAEFDADMKICDLKEFQSIKSLRGLSC